MRLLLDTNIFLEEHELFASDFSLHSIGLLLFRRHRPDVFRQLLADLFLDGAVSVIGLTPGR